MRALMQMRLSWGRVAAVAAFCVGGSLAVAAEETDAAASEKHAGKHKKEVVVRPLSKLDDGAVYGNDGQQIGHINALTIDAGRRKIAYAVVEFDRLADIGDKHFAVPWTALNKKLDPSDPAKVTFAMNADREKLKNAKGFDKNNWPNMADSQWGREVHTFWNAPAYWEEKDASRVTVRTDETGVDVDVKKEDSPARLEGTPVSPDRGPILVRSNQLVGHDVLDENGKEFGDLHEVMADAHSGKLIYGILQIDKLPDFNKDYLHPIPFDVMDLGLTSKDQDEKLGSLVNDADAFKITLKTTSDKVKNGPKFPEREWPNMTQQWGEGVYSSYGVKPFWSKMPRGE